MKLFFFINFILLHHLIKADIVKNLRFTKCTKDSTDDFSFKNIAISIDESRHGSKLTVSGTLNTSVDLESPLWVNINIKRKILYEWVTIPCYNNFGSCTYHDICSYGTPKGMPCSPIFQRDHIPCRCPLKPGVYRIPITTLEAPRVTFPIDGAYKGGFSFVFKNKQIACYYFSFRIDNEQEYQFRSINQTSGYLPLDKFEYNRLE